MMAFKGSFVLAGVGSVLAASLIGCQSTPPTPGAIEIAGVRNLAQAGDVYIAGRPDADGLAALKARGVATVIDLRQAGEVGQEALDAAEQAGLVRVHLPMTSSGITDEQAKTFLEVMKKHDRRPVLIHCGGANRAGAMYGLYLGATGKCTPEEALARARQAGMRSEGLASDLKRHLGAAPD